MSRVVDTQLTEESQHDLVLLKELFRWMQPYQTGLIGSLLLLPLLAGLSLLQPFVLRATIDGPVQRGDWTGLWLYTAGFFLLFILSLGVRYFQMSLSQTIGAQMIYDLRVKLFAHIESLPLSFFQAHPIGKLVTRVTSDVENLSEMFSSGGIAIISDLAIVAGAVLGMFLMDARLAWVVVAMLPVILIVTDWLRRKSRNAYDAIRQNVSWVNIFVEENLSGMEVVQLYQREAWNQKQFQKINTESLRLGLQSVFFDSSLSAVVECLSGLTLLLILWFGGQALNQEAMSFGLLLAFFQFAQMMISPIEDVSEKLTIIQAGMASMDKLVAVLSVTPPAQSSLPPLSQRLRGGIDLLNVDFGYLAEGPLVLKNVTAHIAPGQLIALVGPSGSGKTTLAKLLAGFYIPQQGQIKVDQHEISQYSPQSLRQQVILLQQDESLFSRSVAENISLSATTAPEALEKIRACLEAVGADRVLKKLTATALNEHDVLQVSLDARGKTLSVGERQLILFARALYHDPAILILDEATAAIDPQTEAIVQEAMRRVMIGRTVIVIAHRLSTITQADCIWVMKQGKIVESGTHSELLMQEGLYQQLWEYQQQWRLTYQL